MKRRRLVTVAAFCMGISGAAQAAPGFGFGGELRSWRAKLDAKISSDKGTVAGSDIDVGDDLDVDTTDQTAEGEVWVRLFANRFTFGWVSLGNDGRRALTQSLTFKGKTYSVADTVSSKFDLTILDGTYERPLPFIGTWGDSSLNFQVGMKWLDFKGEIASTLVGTSRANERVPIPQGGLALRLVWQPFELHAGAKGIAVDVEDVRGSLVDARLAAGVRWWGVGFSGGYRYLGIFVKTGGTDIDFSYAGPYVAASFEF